MATSGERSTTSGTGQGGSAANVLTGLQSFAATAAATTVITVPAGRTWVGTVSLACDVAVAGASAVAGQATGTVSIAGAGATPAAGNVFSVSARAGANVAAGTVGTQGANSASVPLTVVAPAGNSVAVQVAATIAGTAGDVNCTCSGSLQ